MKKRAFSLIELSIVILIIGILVAGVTQGSRLIGQFRLQNARNLTQSSPVASIKNLEVWYEASSTLSFSESEQEEEVKVSSWNDINPQSTFKINATNTTPETSPTYYSSCINSIPCVRFDGVDDALELETNSFIDRSNYSIFIVERNSGGTAGFFLAGSDLEVFRNLQVGYKDFRTIQQSHRDFANEAVVSYHSPSKARIHTFLFSQEKVNGNFHSKLYQLNGGVDTPLIHRFSTAPNIPGTATKWGPVPVISWAGASIGGSSVTSFFHGDISEIIIFSRMLKTKEITEIREYLSNKYDISLTDT